jgi:hypothetical protein
MLFSILYDLVSTIIGSALHLSEISVYWSANALFLLKINLVI